LKEYRSLILIEAMSLYYFQAGISVEQGLVPVIQSFSYTVTRVETVYQGLCIACEAAV
jgi:hypothetical protein